MNNVVLIGRLAKDPMMSFSKGKGTAIAKLTVAVNRMQKGEADFINCTAFGKTAETIGNYMTKGSSIAINGELRVNNYKKDDGTWVNNTSVIINRFEFVSAGKQSNNNSNDTEQQLNDLMGSGPEIVEDGDGDIPF